MNWILAYYQAIMDGRETVGAYIRKWYTIIVHGLESKRYTLDTHRAQQCINFIERYCHHHEGPLAPGLIKLELWQKALLSVVFGIFDKKGDRQFTEIVLVIARKQGKTALMSGVGCYHLFVDGGYGARIHIAATKLDQARLCYEGIYQMIRTDPTMDAQTKRRRTDIYIQANNSSAQAVAFSAHKSDGLNTSLGILDEFGAFVGEAGLRQADVIKSGQGARVNPQLFYTSTANFVDEGLFDEIMRRSTAVIEETSKEERLAPFLYVIDDETKWNDINEIKKAMPNLGVSVSVDYILSEIAVAEGSLTKKAEFLTKYCNIKQNRSQAWFNASDIRGAFGSSYTFEDFKDCYAVGGIDLSQSMDLTSCCVLIERDGVIWVFSHFFLPHKKLAEATARDGIPYQIMVQRGLLTLSGDDLIDYHDCQQWFKDLVYTYKIYPLIVGYDRYCAQYLVQDMQRSGFHMESVFQGYNLTGIENDLEGLLKGGKIKSADDNDLLKLHLKDACQQIETGTSAHPRKKLVKISKNAHVDGVAAILDALCMRANHWDDMGGRLQNRREAVQSGPD